MTRAINDPAVRDWYSLPPEIIRFFRKISSGSHEDVEALKQLTSLFDLIKETNEKAKRLSTSSCSELASVMIALSIQRETFIRLSLSLIMELHREKIGDFLVNVLNFRRTNAHKNIVREIKAERLPNL